MPLISTATLPGRSPTGQPEEEPGGQPAQRPVLTSRSAGTPSSGRPDKGPAGNPTRDAPRRRVQATPDQPPVRPPRPTSRSGATRKPAPRIYMPRTSVGELMPRCRHQSSGPPPAPTPLPLRNRLPPRSTHRPKRPGRPQRASRPVHRSRHRRSTHPQPTPRRHRQLPERPGSRS